MALPTPEEVQSLVAELANVAQAYSTSPDLNGYMSRVQVIAKAKKLTQSLISPEQLPNYHGLNVRSILRHHCQFLTDQILALDGRRSRYSHIHETQSPRSNSADWLNITPQSRKGHWRAGVAIGYAQNID
jgi:hypothetical protein